MIKPFSDKTISQIIYCSSTCLIHVTVKALTVTSHRDPLFFCVTQKYKGRASCPQASSTCKRFYLIIHERQIVKCNPNPMVSLIALVPSKSLFDYHTPYPPTIYPPAQCPQTFCPPVVGMRCEGIKYVFNHKSFFIPTNFINHTFHHHTYS